MRIVVAVLASIVVVSIVAMMLGDNYAKSVYLDETGHSALDSPDVYKALTMSHKLGNYVQSRMNSLGQEIPVIHVSLSPKSLYLLRKDQEQAVRQKMLLDPVSVPGDIVVKNRRIKAKVRLKGELPDHWSSMYRASLNISLQHESPLLPAQKFSIQKPASRQFPYDHVYQKLRKSLGLIDRDRSFVHVFVNGEDWGIMDMEEQFGKDFFYNHSLDESPIFKFGDHHGDALNRLYREASLWGHPRYDWSVYNNIKMGKRRAVYSYFVQEWFVNKHVEVFDEAVMAREMRLAELIGTYHPLIYSNIRYYANPYTLKLEPITSDADAIMPALDMPGYLFYVMNMNQVWPALLGSSRFMDSYNGPSILDAANMCGRVGALNKETSRYFVYQTHDDCPQLSANLATDMAPLHDKLHLNHDGLPTSGHVGNAANIADHQGNVLNILYYSDGMVRIQNLSYVDVDIVSVVGKGEDAHPLNIHVPSASRGDDSVVTAMIPLTGVRDDLMFEMSIGGKIVRQSAGYALDARIRNWEASVTFVDGPASYGAGKHEVKRSVIHRGHVLIEPGADFRLCESCSMMFLDGVDMRGEVSKPVSFAPIDRQFGGVFVINQAGERSDITHMRLQGATGVSNGPYQMDAGLTLYGGSYGLNDVSVSDSRVEDMLHVFKAEASINGLSISGGKSDGLDIDYGTVSLSNSTFHDLGGDAVDTSKTKINLHGIRADQVHDKGVSLGEGSIAMGDDIAVSGASACVVAKDSSVGRFDKVRVSSCSLFDVMAYIKKDKFVGGDISIDDLDHGTLPLRYFEDESSSISINGDNLLPNGTRKQVREFYSSGFMVK